MGCVETMVNLGVIKELKQWAQPFQASCVLYEWGAWKWQRNSIQISDQRLSIQAYISWRFIKARVKERGCTLNRTEVIDGTGETCAFRYNCKTSKKSLSSIWE